MKSHLESLVFLCCALVAALTVARYHRPYIRTDDWNSHPVWTAWFATGRVAEAETPPRLGRDLSRTGTAGLLLAGLAGAGAMGLALGRRRAGPVLRRMALLAALVGAAAAVREFGRLMGGAWLGVSFEEFYAPRSVALAAIRLGFGLAAALLSLALLLDATSKREVRP